MNLDGSKPRHYRFQFSIKAVMILTLVVAAYFAGRAPEHRRAREAELRARDAAQRAMMAADQAIRIADQSFQRAQVALEETRKAEASLAAERKSTNEDPE